MRFLGLDYGDRRIGVAVSDPLGWTAGGLLVLERKNPIDHKACIEKIVKTVLEYEVIVIVIGLPKNMDGTEGENCRKVRTFASQLKKVIPNVEIEFFDERLSTSRALQIFHEQGINEKKRGQGSIDKKAAELILQSYLDALSLKNKETKEKFEMANVNDDSIFEMEDDEMEMLVVTDDEGNELEYIIIDEFAHSGVNYLVMMLADDIEAEEPEAAIFKQIPTDDEEEFAFEEITEEEYDMLEDMLKKRLEEAGIDLE